MRSVGRAMGNKAFYGVGHIIIHHLLAKSMVLWIIAWKSRPYRRDSSLSGSEDFILFCDTHSICTTSASVIRSLAGTLGS